MKSFCNLRNEFFAGLGGYKNCLRCIMIKNTIEIEYRHISSDPPEKLESLHIWEQQGNI